MTIKLNKEIVALLQDEQSVKVLATVGADGSPHVSVKQSIAAGDDGNIFFLELLESSRTNRNLVRAIWHDHRVSIAIRKGSESWQIKGKPVRAHVAGPVFQREYVRVRKLLGDVDLAAVWVIEPEEILNQSWLVRKNEEEIAHPNFVHLDKIQIHSPSAS